MDSRDEHFLRRAIELATIGRGRVEPNPMVGCVIVKNDHLIGVGVHVEFGGDHAEPTALRNCSESPQGATAYVTLEPCCHTNKKTPPCAPRLIEAKIARVVIGCLDPNPDVNGKGVAMLRDAGIQVDGPLLENEAKQLIAPFLAATRFRRPYVTLKWAQSSNGLVAARMGTPVRITNSLSDLHVHALRGRCDAIAVGTNTVLNDDPLLTVRGVKSMRTPRRIILSNSLKISMQSRLVQTAYEHPVLLYCSRASAAANRSTVHELRNAGVHVIPLDDHEGRFSFSDVLHDLHSRGVTHLLIEPGPTLARAMIERSQADRVWIFRSPNEIEAPYEEKILRAPTIDYPATGSINLRSDILTEYLNPNSEVFYAPVPSADFRHVSLDGSTG